MVKVRGKEVIIACRRGILNYHSELACVMQIMPIR
jgi:3-deoxy-D-arabino-heptulosonate 7-phosphate (DAHP) synthase